MIHPYHARGQTDFGGRGLGCAYVQDLWGIKNGGVKINRRVCDPSHSDLGSLSCWTALELSCSFFLIQRASILV